MIESLPPRYPALSNCVNGIPQILLSPSHPLVLIRIILVAVYREILRYVLPPLLIAYKLRLLIKSSRTDLIELLAAPYNLV